MLGTASNASVPSLSRSVLVACHYMADQAFHARTHQSRECRRRLKAALQPMNLGPVVHVNRMYFSIADTGAAKGGVLLAIQMAPIKG